MAKGPYRESFTQERAPANPKKIFIFIILSPEVVKKILSHGKEQRTKITAIRLAVLHDLMFIKVSNLKRNSCDFSPVL